MRVIGTTARFGDVNLTIVLMMRQCKEGSGSAGLRYNFNFPQVPSGTFTNDQVCICHWRRRIFPR